METNRIQFLRKKGLDASKSYSISELAKIADVPEPALNAVFRRGIGAYKSNLESVRLKDFSKNPDIKKYPASARLSPEQWAYARLYSFLNRGKTYKTADADIARMYGY